MIAGAYHWSYSEIFNLPTDRAFAFVYWIKEAERGEQLFALQAADFPWMKKADRRMIRNRIASSGGGRVKKSAYDYADSDEEMLRMIGDALKTGGDEWARKHPKRMAWIRRKGYTPQDAIDAVDEFTQERLEILKRPRSFKSATGNVGEVSRQDEDFGDANK